MLYKLWSNRYWKKIKEQFENWKQLNCNRIYINKAKQEKIDLDIESLGYSKIAIKKQILIT